MGKLVTVTGASGSGKTTLVRKCQKIFQKEVSEVVSVTTRPKRTYEINAMDYYFVDEDDFSDMDLTAVTLFNGNHYGIDRYTIEQCLKRHKVSFVIVDHNGAKELKEEYGDRVLSVFIHSAPSTAYSRVLHRDGEDVANERKIADVESGLVASEFDTDYDLVLSANNTKNAVLRKFLAFLEENTELETPFLWKKNLTLKEGD